MASVDHARRKVCRHIFTIVIIAAAGVRPDPVPRACRQVQRRVQGRLHPRAGRARHSLARQQHSAIRPDRHLRAEIVPHMRDRDLSIWREGVAQGEITPRTDRFNNCAEQRSRCESITHCRAQRNRPRERRHGVRRGILGRHRDPERLIHELRRTDRRPVEVIHLPRQSVVVRYHTGAPLDCNGRIRRPAQVDVERLVGFDRDVPVHLHRHRPARHPRREHQRPVRRHVVAAL